MDLIILQRNTPYLDSTKTLYILSELKNFDIN